MSNSNGMYKVLDIFKGLEPTPQEQVKEEAKKIYESVEAQGSVLAGVSKVEQRLAEQFAATKEGKYGDNGIDYSGKFGDRKAEKPPVDTKFDTRGIASMMGKKPSKHFGKVSASNTLALPGEDDEFSDEVPGSLDSALKHMPKIKEAEMDEGKPRNKYAIGMAAAKKAAGYGKKPAHNLPKSVIKKGHEIAKNIDEAEPTMPSKKPEQAKKKPVSPFGKQPVAEGVNFSEMMKKQHATLEEMLKTLSDDINEFKRSGHVSEPLRDCMSVYEWGKQQLNDARHVPHGSSFAPQMPSGEDILPAPKTEPSTLGKIGGAMASGAKAVGKAIVGKDDDELLADLSKKSTMEEELNELARLAGLSLDEGVDKKAFAALAEPKDKITYADKIAGATKNDTMDEESHGEWIKQKDKEAEDKGKKSFKAFGQTFDTDEVNESADQLDECGGMMSPMGSAAMGMEQAEGKINVSTNMSSDGNKSVSINADGNAADQLMQMLKMAGLGGGEAHAKLAIAVPTDGGSGEEVEMEEAQGEAEYANVPHEEYEGQDVINHQGADMNREKKQYADKPKAGDNPMATPESVDPVASFGRDLMAEYKALKLQK